MAAKIDWRANTGFVSNMQQETIGEPGEYHAEVGDGKLLLRVEWDSRKRVWRGRSSVNVMVSAPSSTEAKEKLVEAIRVYAQELLDLLK